MCIACLTERELVMQMLTAAHSDSEDTRLQKVQQDESLGPIPFPMAQHFSEKA